MSSIERLTVLKSAIRDVPDFPKPGIVFKDITPLLNDPGLFRSTMDELAALAGDLRPDKVVAIESRGFILGGALADRLGAGFVPVRKPGKLPSKRVSCSYELEYGSDSVEIHADAFGKSDRVLVVDDVIATGGTARAAGQLVEELGATLLGYLFLIELTFLGGRERLAGGEIRSLIRY